MKTLTTLILALSTTLTLAAKSKPAVDAPGLVDATFKPFVADGGGLHGIAVGVRRGDDTWHAYYGATGKPGLAFDGKTLIEIASVSKTFTGLCLAELVREGKVKLDDPLQKWVPTGVTVPSMDGRVVTLLDMVTHTSGLPVPGPQDKFFPPMTSFKFWKLAFLHVIHWDWSNPALGLGEADIWEVVSKAKLHAKPGTHWEYSNIGMGTLGMVLARADGEKDFEALMKKRVAGPLGMDSTEVTLTPALVARRAEGYTEAGKPSAHLGLGPLAGAGGLKSDLDDLMKYLDLHLGRRKADLPDLTQSAALMQVVYRELDEKNYHRMLPLAWHYDAKANIYYHSGTGLGYHSYIGFDPKGQTGVVLLANSAAQVVEEIGPELIKALEGKPANIPKPLVAVEVPEEKRKALEGDYKFDDGNVVTFKVAGKGLSIDFHNAKKKPSQLWPRSENSYFCKEWDCRVEFTKDSAAVKMYYNTYVAKKVTSKEE